MKVHVIGTGLIGTSVGLALAGHADVVLSDPSPAHLDRAVARGAGRPWDGGEGADLVLVCAPPAATAALLINALRLTLGTTVSHVASHQSQVQAEVEAKLGHETGGLCGSHPLAGRERSGPDAATARLFLDRPWVVCPGPRTTAEASQAVVALAEACGAVPVTASAEQHDAAVALVSHLPQVAASAVAARLLPQLTSAPDALDPVRLAGPGVQDTTRIAASDPDLWVEVLSRNAAHVAPLVQHVSDDLAAVAAALRQLAEADVPGLHDTASATVRSLLERGRSGRERLPLKGSRPRPLDGVVVSISDRPGQLAAVMVAAAEAGINVEDVHVEHLPGRQRGAVELLVAETEAARARRALADAGWDVLDGS
jgi:prephenate dehydrogenase